MPRMARGIFLAWALCFSSAADAGYAEVLSREIGPRSAFATNNTNQFDWSRAAKASVHADCDLARFQAQYGRAPCDKNMQWVCSRFFQISVCVDQDLARDSQGRVLGNQNRSGCVRACAASKKRLLDNNEWLVACTGSPISACVNYGGEWPPAHFAKIPGHPCRVYGVESDQCMQNPDLTALMPAIQSACVSEALVKGCIGTLGQWVSDGIAEIDAPRGRFNGGLFPQPASSAVYTTTAHDPGYSDYSMGCRCGKDVAALGD